MLDLHEVLPPGEDPLDSSRPDVDAVGFALERVQTMLIWVEEHRASFEKLRQTDPEGAAAELNNLKDATEQAVLYLQRLTELLLSGQSIDTHKRLPKGLCSDVWVRFVETLHRGHLAANSSPVP